VGGRRHQERGLEVGKIDLGTVEDELAGFAVVLEDQPFESAGFVGGLLHWALGMGVHNFNAPVLLVEFPRSNIVARGP
jgi:hypothetical protein